MILFPSLEKIERLGKKGKITLACRTISKKKGYYRFQVVLKICAIFARGGNIEG